jgi:hypothetical protein
VWIRSTLTQTHRKTRRLKLSKKQPDSPPSCDN